MIYSAVQILISLALLCTYKLHNRFFIYLTYRKNSENWSPQKSLNCSKNEIIMFNNAVMHPKDDDGVAKSAV